MGAGPVGMSALQPVSDEVDRRPLRHYVPGKWTDHAQGTSSPFTPTLADWGSAYFSYKYTRP